MDGKKWGSTSLFVSLSFSLSIVRALFNGQFVLVSRIEVIEPEDGKKWGSTSLVNGTKVS